MSSVVLMLLRSSLTNQRASQASYSEKLMRLKHELATTAKLVSGVFKHGRLKREASQLEHSPAWLTFEYPRAVSPAGGLRNAKTTPDFANLERKFPSLQVYAHFCSLRMCELKDGPYRRIWEVKLKPRDTNGNLTSPVSHLDTVVRPEEHAAAILAQVHREMARIKERDHHWEDGTEVSCLAYCNLGSTHRQPSYFHEVIGHCARGGCQVHRGSQAATSLPLYTDVRRRHLSANGRPRFLHSSSSTRTCQRRASFRGGDSGGWCQRETAGELGTEMRASLPPASVRSHAVHAIITHI